ncbi:E3 ubiquitin-protein ligase FANCL [Linum perenne]
MVQHFEKLEEFWSTLEDIDNSLYVIDSEQSSRNDELGSMSGSATDYTCENTNCSRDFHSVCLLDWLRSITTTRQSIDVLFGICPYSSDPVPIKIIDA